MTHGSHKAHFTDAQLDEMYEASKRDFQFVGSEIRQLIGDIKTARAALTASPATAESNASVEARLREALERIIVADTSQCEVRQYGVNKSIDMEGECAIIAREALSVGDEAKKSEGGPLNWQLSDDAQARIAEIESHIVHPGDPRLATVIGGGSAFCGHNIMKSLCLECTPGQATPSSPTAERREIVARLADELAVIAYRGPNSGDSLALFRAASVLRSAALDGGAGA